MNRIIEHIEHILYLNNKVIIPRIGEFSLQNVPAEYREYDHSFIPSQKKIVYNSHINHDDGLLAQDYMQCYSVDLHVACKMIEQDLNSLSDNIDAGSIVRIWNNGLLTKYRGKYLFISDKEYDYQFNTSSSFGLPFFHFLPLTYLHVEHNNASKIMFHKDKQQYSDNVVFNFAIKRSFFKIVGIAASVILLFFLLSPPINDVNSSLYSASLIPEVHISLKQIEQQKTYKEESDNKLFVDNSEQHSSFQTDILSSSSTIEKKSNLNSSNESYTKELTALNTKSTTSSTAPSNASTNFAAKPYFVIIGSFANKAQANKYINHEMKGVDKTTVGILVRDGRVRVYSQHFANEAEAQRHIEQLQKNPRHRQAWLYVFK